MKIKGFRWWIIGLIFLATVINYIDRSALAIMWGNENVYGSISQSLGLTKYEIPIDSRITNWLNNFGFPVSLTSSPLGDKGYYHFVSDGIQELCIKARIYPCLLDAAIFSSFDNGEWTDENTIF